MNRLIRQSEPSFISAARKCQLPYPRFAKDYPRFSPRPKKTLKTGGKRLVMVVIVFKMLKSSVINIVLAVEGTI